MTPYKHDSGKYNIDSEDLKLMLEYSKDKKYTTLINIATPGGMEEMDSVCITRTRII